MAMMRDKKLRHGDDDDEKKNNLMEEEESEDEDEEDESDAKRKGSKATSTKALVSKFGVRHDPLDIGDRGGFRYCLRALPPDDVFLAENRRPIYVFTEDKLYFSDGYDVTTVSIQRDALNNLKQILGITKNMDPSVRDLSPEQLKEIVGVCGQIGKFERRLDSLARLLEGSTMCTAVAIISGNLCITANSIAAHPQIKDGQSAKRKVGPPQSVLFIEKVMNYFKSIANSQEAAVPMDVEGSKEGTVMIPSEKIFHDVAWQTLKALGRNNIFVASGGDGRTTVKMIAQEVIELSSNILKKSARELINSCPNREPGDVLYAYAVLERLYSDFEKTQSSIRKAASGNFSEIEKELFEAIKKFSEANILRRDEDDVHAEIKMLGAFVDQLVAEKSQEKEKPKKPAPPPAIASPKKIHVGISKLCCFKCEQTLHAANEVLASRTLPSIGFRGWHDSWHAKWALPAKFGNFKFTLRGVKTKSDTSSSAFSSGSAELYSQIGKKVADNFSIWCKKAETEFVSEKKQHHAMVPRRSFSRAFSPEQLRQRHLDYIVAKEDELLHQQEVLISLLYNKPLSEDKKFLLSLFQLGKSLHEIQNFKDLFTYQISEEFDFVKTQKFFLGLESRMQRFFENFPIPRSPMIIFASFFQNSDCWNKETRAQVIFDKKFLQQNGALFPNCPTSASTSSSSSSSIFQIKPC